MLGLTGIEAQERHELKHLAAQRRVASRTRWRWHGRNGCCCGELARPRVGGDGAEWSAWMATAVVAVNAAARELMGSWPRRGFGSCIAASCSPPGDAVDAPGAGARRCAVVRLTLQVLRSCRRGAAARTISD